MIAKLHIVYNVTYIADVDVTYVADVSYTVTLEEHVAAGATIEWSDEINTHAVDVTI